ncbi:GTPase IMAP family member 4 [Lampris incognitus]|uniref:GTPase IMAP family member 4 n=1 Tax=Lampris incognitus TaxID=2546036 RepID=UPI0024B5092E|nr:GTPase IMAP family member 4 [Lampris incognitus]
METKRPQKTTDVFEPEDEEKKKAAAALVAANRLPELRLVLLGWRWPGKSLTGNTILGREEFHLERATEFSVKRQTEVDGRQVIVVDTPGWFSTQSTPPSYQQEIVKGVSMCSPGPHAFLLVIPVGMFSEVDRARVEEHLNLFGEHVWRHTIVVFTWAEVLKNISIERYIRREGKDLQWVLEKCKRRYFVINNFIFGAHPQLGRLMERVEKMVAEEGDFYSPEEIKEKGSLDVNQNPSQNQMREGRELGARPKQKSVLGLAKAVEVDPSCN